MSCSPPEPDIAAPVARALYTFEQARRAACACPAIEPGAIIVAMVPPYAAKRWLMSRPGGSRFAAARGRIRNW